jgi:hypothetical protein
MDDSMINFRAIFDGVLASILFAVTLMQAPAKKKTRRKTRKQRKARQAEVVAAESHVAEEEVMPAPKQARIISKAFSALSDRQALFVPTMRGQSTLCRRTKAAKSILPGILTAATPSAS